MVKRIAIISFFILAICVFALANQPYRGGFFYKHGNVNNLLMYAGLTQDSNTKVLLHCNGSDGSTTITDDGDTGHTVTAQGSAALSTDAYRFSTASLKLSGNAADYVSIPDHADFNFGSGRFTIDCWVRLDLLFTGAGTAGIFQQKQGTDDRFDFAYVYSAGQHLLRFSCYSSAATVVSFNGEWSPVVDQWFHIALIRGWGDNDNGWAITVNGKAVATTTDSDTMPNLSTATFDVGRYSSVYGWDGFIDEFRLVKGAAKWTNDFVPYWEPYN